ncbi:MAG: glycosyltransferase family 4 protein, partial [Thermoleophilaceae bacterium]|nr:glycosyltransferase family 4 protein [Thermoleophilaceae bacterium]
MMERGRLLVVSHPAVLPVNQLVYAELAERGWRVDIVVPDHWEHEYGHITPEPLPALAACFHRLPIVFGHRPQRHLYRARPLHLLRQLRPDVLFLEQEPFSAVGLQWGLAAHRAGLPFGVQAAENLDRLLPLPVRMWRAWVLRHAAFVAARSETAASLVRRWGATGDVRLIPHHVPEWPVPSRTADAAFRVGFAGRLVPEKGLDILVDAIHRLGVGVELVIVGDGPLRSWLQEADLGGAGLRVLTGLGHDEMAGAYATMDVLVLPSRTTSTWAEQFGRVLVEALWCGVPVVGSDSGEIPWVIDITGGGLVFPENDAAALAVVLGELRANPGERTMLAERGRRAVRETFGVPAVADDLEEVLRLVAIARPG